MLSFLRNRRLRTKFLMLAAVFLTSLAGTIGVASYLQSQRMMADRTLELKAVVDVAYGAAEALQEQVVAGKLTRDQAEEQFRQFVHHTRHGTNNDYIFVLRYDGTTIANPMPDSEGKSGWDRKSADGRYISRELIAAGRGGSGILEYTYPRLQGGDPVGKRSYARGFAPWDVVIATGAYTDDFAADVRGQVMVLSMAGIIAMIAAGIPAWLLGTSPAP